MRKKKIIIGSRDSKLAVMQTELVMEQIRKCNPDLELELITLKTTGDLILDKTLDKIGGKGLFVKELDQALLDGRIDLAIHSLKDMPMDISDDLPIVALPKRGDVRDALILPKGKTLENIDKEILLSNIGSSSNRRKLQIEKLYTGVQTTPVRGNIITRIAKLDRGEYSALILAAAGLHRVGLENRISKYFSVEEMIPAAGQGILSVQSRKDLDVSFLEAINDRLSTYCATAERSFVRVLNGGCSSPIAAHARVSGNEIKLVGLHYNESTKEHIIDSIVGDVLKAEALGETLANKLRGVIG